ncbi:MAG TPA: hypothetical protein VFI73_12060 [Candidatus Nitrosopolaris sp.]|nr:hypothetical protein [Candidatus Nitrosopolaris sp.]
MINDKDHFTLLKTISGIKENVDKMATLCHDDTQYVRNEFLEYMQMLIDVVNTVHESVSDK